MTRKAHIISHSHWDREWYMSYQKHHLRLIELIDTVLEAAENDEQFDSFHLDGQTICIEDYLEIKPENEQRLRKAIQDGKIKIGPWYILQDAFLTSSEANVRNMQVGHEICKKYGEKNHVGYFPDTFGIYGQAAQILQQSEIDNMIFGRGVTPTGFNNQILDEYSTKSSELLIGSPNGDNVLGILFANWYNNADDIPVDKQLAKKYWDQKLSDAQKYTNCNNLLFMHGCDHTPYDSTVTEAIQVANQLYDDVEFVHSNFDTFLTEIKAELDCNRLTKVSGELTNQNTDGYNTLVNTASSRINQKLMNVYVQDKYEKIVEPLYTMLAPAEMYPHAELNYGWKKLLQNHPHDSICGCSVDSVHKGMDLRFEEANDIADVLIENVLNYYKEHVEVKLGEKKFTAFNPTSTKMTQLREFDIVVDKVEIKGEPSASYELAECMEIPNFQIVCEGQSVDYVVMDENVKFNYILPNDKFRKAYFEKVVKVKVKLELDAYSWKTFEVHNVENVEKKAIVTTDKDNSISNEIYDIAVIDGKLELTYKVDGIKYKDFLKIIDEGDIGNEYMFGQIIDDKLIQWEIKESYSERDILSEKLHINAQLIIPQKAENSLIAEQQRLVQFNKRYSKRDDQKMCIVPIELSLVLQPGNSDIDINISIDNQATDHRVRVLLNPGVVINDYEVDSIFEVVTRNSECLEAWENPSADNRQSKFLSVPVNDMMFSIANNGLPEYEILEKKYVAITLLRAVGELGDWGYFPTIDSQCLGMSTSKLTINIHGQQSKTRVFNSLRNHFCKLPMVMLSDNLIDGPMPLDGKKDLGINIEGDLFISSYKRNIANEPVVRLFSNGRSGKITSTYQVKKTNLLEEKKLEVADNFQVKANEIITIITQ